MIPRKLTTADIALAMELATEGYQQQHIATGLGVCTKALRANIRYAEQNGIRKEAAPVCRRNRIACVNSQAASRIGTGAKALAGHGESALVECVGAEA